MEDNKGDIQSNYMTLFINNNNLIIVQKQYFFSVENRNLLYMDKII